MKTILILCIVILVLLLAVFLLFKAWRKNVQKYKDEHERAERLRYQVELAQNEARIKKEVFDEAEKENLIKELIGFQERDWKHLKVKLSIG